jgi:hypothetical protein
MVGRRSWIFFRSSEAAVGTFTAFNSRTTNRLPIHRNVENHVGELEIGS